MILTCWTSFTQKTFTFSEPLPTIVNFIIKPQLTWTGEAKRAEKHPWMKQEVAQCVWWQRQCGRQAAPGLPLHWDPPAGSALWSPTGPPLPVWPDACTAYSASTPTLTYQKLVLPSCHFPAPFSGVKLPHITFFNILTTPTHWTPSHMCKDVWSNTTWNNFRRQHIHTREENRKCFWKTLSVKSLYSFGSSLGSIAQAWEFSTPLTPHITALVVSYTSEHQAVNSSHHLDHSHSDATSAIPTDPA